MDTKKANDAYIAASRACDADPTPATLAAVTAAATTLSALERAAGANPFKGEAERVKAERLALEAHAASRVALARKRAAGLDPEWTAEMAAYDADVAALDRAMNTEPDDL